MIDLSFISSSTWKLISIISIFAFITMIGVSSVKSCDAKKLDNKRLEEINSLNKELSNIKQDNINLENRILGLQSENEHQKAIILSKNAEIESLTQLQEKYEQAICRQQEVSNKIQETVGKDEESREWFDQKIPDSIYQILVDMGGNASTNDDDVCM